MPIVKQGIISNVGVEVGYLDIVSMQYMFDTGETSVVVEGWVNEQARIDGKEKIYIRTHVIPAGVNTALLTQIAEWVYPYIQTNHYGE